MAPTDFVSLIGRSMASIDTTSLLSKRYYCGYDTYDCSGWSYYGRWIFAAVVIVVILAISFLLACVNSRRRRRRGVAPMYGTGWMAGNQHHQNNPNAYYNNNQQPPPAYGAGQSYPMQDQQYNPQGGYYGQREGVEQPKNTPGGEYAPPPGPPPAKVH